MHFGWYRKPSLAEQKAKAERERRKLLKEKRALSPVLIQGRTIARTFWGQAWCHNLERYSDYENRLPRGRSYVTNGLVLDLQITAGRIEALVSGSDLYHVEVTISPLPADRWQALCADCAGGIASVVELLQGRFSNAVMERLCRPGEGLFPTPAEIKLACSCPDWADLCKHVAAVLYGIGARLDRQPELLFLLRQVDQEALTAAAAFALPQAIVEPPPGRRLGEKALAELFKDVLGSGARGIASPMVEYNHGASSDPGTPHSQALSPTPAKGRRRSGGPS